MSTFAPLVCIVMLNNSQKEKTLACLESLKATNYPNFQIIVIDNASKDQSVSEIHLSFPDIRVIELKQNRGCSGGRNIGLQEANLKNADYVLFLDNDTIVYPDFLSSLINVMETDPKIGIASSLIIHEEDESLCWMAGGLINENGTTTALYFNQGISNVPHMVYEVDWVPGCVLLTRRDVYTKVGSFNDIYFFYFEDIDWCIRASASGYRIMVVPQSKVKHKISQSLGGRNSSRRLYYWVRNRLIFANQYQHLYSKWGFLTTPIIIEETRNAIRDLWIRQPKRTLARIIAILHFLFGKSGFYELF